MLEALLHPLQALVRAHERRAAVRTYSALSDHLLQDIGIERKFIEDVVALEERRSLDEGRRARTVFSAGVGTAMELIEMGHCPIIVPRRANRDEHVDDHQTQIARSLVARGLVRSCEADELPVLLSGEAAAAGGGPGPAPHLCSDGSPARSS